ncbi:MAG TPA: hypothetical protein VF667_04325, partial [Pseudonocardia sp.]
ELNNAVEEAWPATRPGRERTAPAVRRLRAEAARRIPLRIRPGVARPPAAGPGLVTGGIVRGVLVRGRAWRARARRAAVVGRPSRP